MIDEHTKNRNQNCLICKNPYQINNITQCPHCGYPFFSVSDNKEQNRQEMISFRKHIGIKTSSLTLGQTIKLGRYQGQEISWRVLAIRERYSLVITEYGLDARRFHNNEVDVTWETSTVRKWLNTDFIDSAFSKGECKKIIESTVTGDRNPRTKTNPGNDTNDKIFLLSIQEAEQYFENNEIRMTAPTDYAKRQGAYEDNRTKCCWWWLRTPGNYSYNTAFVSKDGSINYQGRYVNPDKICIRPAMWISM